MPPGSALASRVSVLVSVRSGSPEATDPSYFQLCSAARQSVRAICSLALSASASELASFRRPLLPTSSTISANAIASAGHRAQSVEPAQVAALSPGSYPGYGLQ